MLITHPWEDYSGHPSLFVVHLLSCAWLSAAPWTAALQAPLSSTVFQSLLKFMSIELVMPSNHLILCHPLILLPFPYVARQSPLSMEFSRQRILEWVAASFSRGPSQSRDWTLVSCVCCIGDRFFTAESSGKPLLESAAAAAKSLQTCPTLCDPIDGSPPGSSIPGILQARTLEWVAISFSNAWKWKVKVKSLSHVRLFMTPWTAAFQAPPSMGFSRQEYWSGLPLPSPLSEPSCLYLHNEEDEAYSPELLQC